MEDQLMWNEVTQTIDDVLTEYHEDVVKGYVELSLALRINRVLAEMGYLKDEHSGWKPRPALPMSADDDPGAYQLEVSRPRPRRYRRESNGESGKLE